MEFTWGKIFTPLGHRSGLCHVWHDWADDLEGGHDLHAFPAGTEPLRIALVAVAKHPVAVEVADMCGNGVGDLAKAQLTMTQPGRARRLLFRAHACALLPRPSATGTSAPF